MQAFWGLLTAHLIADFPLQTNTIYALKQRGWYGTLAHTLVHVGVTALLLKSPAAYWPLLTGLGISHFLVDSLKARWHTHRQSLAFLGDQLLHGAVLLTAATLAPDLSFIVPARWMRVFALYALTPMLIMWVALLHADWRAASLRMWSVRRWMRLSQVSGWPLVAGLLLAQLRRLG